jgi:hypothetical protein
MGKDETCKDLPYNAEEGDPVVVVTVTEVSFVFVEGDDVCIARFSGDVSFLPTKA